MINTNTQSNIYNGFTLKEIYQSGKEVLVSYEKDNKDFVLSNYDLRTGENELNIEYKGFSFKEYINVIENTISKIEQINTLKKEFYNDEKIVIENIKLLITYLDNTQEIIENTEEIKYDYIKDNLKIGANELKLSFETSKGMLITWPIEITIIDNKPESIRMINPLDKNTFYEDEEIIFSGLSFSIIYTDGKEIVTDNIKINSNCEYKIGSNKVEIECLGLKYDIEIFIIERPEIIEKKHLSILDKTKYSNYMINIKIKDSYLTLNNILYAKTRSANQIIAFDEINPIKTNIYGYEIGIDEFGEVVSTGTNVSIPNKGLVLSAHGTRVKELKMISIGDYLYYNLFDNDVYVYKYTASNDLKYSNKVFTKYTGIIYFLSLFGDTKEEIIAYNTLTNQMNLITNLLEEYINTSDNEKINQASNLLDEVEILKNNYEDMIFSYNDVDNLDTDDYFYTYSDEIEDYLQGDNVLPYLINNDTDYLSLIAKYEEKLIIGGFRLSNTLVYYDKSCYRTRNEFGYEIAVDKNNIVVEIDTIVNLPEDGYILSGHSSTATFLKDNVRLGDVIVINENVEIYLNVEYYIYNNLIELRNDLVIDIKDNLSRKIPHDYEYINKVLRLLDNSFNVFMKLNDLRTNVYKYITVIRAQLLENNLVETKGLWYYPFTINKYQDDTSLEGVINTLQNIKEMGFNEIIIYPFRSNRILYDSQIYQKWDKLNEYSYGEYGNDYLKCFIEEAHKLNICVNAFTQTLGENIDAMYEPNNDYYQIDFNGNRSFGSIYYYDPCNDDLKEMLVSWYRELITKYDFDKIEYDIIRYPMSSLYRYTNIEVIPSTTEISDHGYSDVSVNKFMEMYDLSGDIHDLIRNSLDIRNKWLEYKENELLRLIQMISGEIRKIKPEMKITAAVLSDYSNAKKVFLQDYKKWYELGLIDEIEPMSYTPSYEEFIEKINSYLGETIIKKFGISTVLDNADTIIDFKQVNQALKEDGFILFSSSQYLGNEILIKAFKTNHVYNLISNIDSKEEILNEYIKDTSRAIYGYYSNIYSISYFDKLLEALNTNDKDLIIKEIEVLDDQDIKTYLLERFIDK